MSTNLCSLHSHDTKMVQRWPCTRISISKHSANICTVGALYCDDFGRCGSIQLVSRASSTHDKKQYVVPFLHLSSVVPFLSFLVLITIVFLLFVFIGQEFQFLQFVPFDGMFKVYLLLFSILFALLSYFIEFGCIFSVMLEGSFTRLE